MQKIIKFLFQIVVLTGLTWLIFSGFHNQAHAQTTDRVHYGPSSISENQNPDNSLYESYWTEGKSMATPSSFYANAPDNITTNDWALDGRGWATSDSIESLEIQIQNFTASVSNSNVTDNDIAGELDWFSNSLLWSVSPVDDNYYAFYTKLYNWNGTNSGNVYRHYNWDFDSVRYVIYQYDLQTDTYYLEANPPTTVFESVDCNNIQEGRLCIIAPLGNVPFEQYLRSSLYYNNEYDYYDNINYEIKTLDDTVIRSDSFVAENTSLFNQSFSLLTSNGVDTDFLIDNTYKLTAWLSDSGNTVTSPYETSTFKLVTSYVYDDTSVEQFDCDWSDFGCNLKMAFAWAFIPNQSVLQNFSSLSLADRAPFGYFVTGQTIIRNFFTMENVAPVPVITIPFTENFTITLLDTNTLASIPQIDTIRLLMAAGIWFSLLMFLYSFVFKFLK